MLVPPTPFLPSTFHIPADQSLLLATEPIWEDDDFRQDFGGMYEGLEGDIYGDETFWMDTPAPAKATKAISTQEGTSLATSSRTSPQEGICGSPGNGPADVIEVRGDSGSGGPERIADIADDRGNAVAGPGPSTVRQAIRRSLDQASTRSHDVYLGGRLCTEQNPTVAPAPTTPDVYDGREPDIHAFRTSKSRAEGGTKRKRGQSPRKSLASSINKRSKEPTPKKDDFYSRRLKDSDRRSSLGPKSPLLPQMMLDSPGNASRRLSHSSNLVSSLASTSASASASISVSDPASARCSASSYPRAVSLPVTNRSTSRMTSVGDPSDGNESSHTEAPAPNLDDRAHTHNRDQLSEQSIKVRGRSALSRYLSKAKGGNTSIDSIHDWHDAASSDRSSNTIFSNDGPALVAQSVSRASERMSRPKSHNVTVDEVVPASADLTESSAMVSTPASIITRVGEVMSGLGSSLRRSLSQQSLAAESTIQSVPETGKVVHASSGEGQDKVEGARESGCYRTSDYDVQASDMSDRPVVDTIQYADVSDDFGNIAHSQARQHTNRPTHTCVQVTTRPLPSSLKLPPPLTRPSRPFGTITASRALQPRIVPNPNTTLDPGLRPAARGVCAAPSSIAAPSSLAARTLAKLPAPGSARSVFCKTTIRDTDRAKGLGEKRERFEGMAREAKADVEVDKLRRSKNGMSTASGTGAVLRTAAGMSRHAGQTQGMGGATYHRVSSTAAAARVSTTPTGIIGARQCRTHSNMPMKRTIPIRGNTPGKASRARAEQREQMEIGRREKNGQAV